jgi:hypothetical protein
MTQTVYVKDTTAPIFSRYVDPFVTVECDCDGFLPVADIDAIDNCDTEGDNLVFTETSEPGTCDQAFEITRQWIATEACGNENSLTQIITVVDTTPPLFCDDFCDEDFVDDSYSHIECDSWTEQPDPLVSDSCDDDVDVQADEPEYVDVSDCPNDKRIVYGWSATDDCGNTATCETIIDIEDTTAPQCTNCEQLCYPLAGYGPTETEYAVYHKPENLIVAEDNCGDIDSIELLSCNSTQHDSEGQLFDDESCVYVGSTNNLYVHMANADASDHHGRYYYLWFRITDDCGIENIVSRAIWIPPTSFAYHRAVDRDQCLNGLAETAFVQNLPTAL